MTMPFNFFKNTGELERINNLHTGSTKPKVVVVSISKEDSYQHKQLLKNVRGLCVLEKPTN